MKHSKIKRVAKGSWFSPPWMCPRGEKKEKKSSHSCERVPWLLGEELQLPWLLWPAHGYCGPHINT
jgi:hypothetical protein